MGYKGKHTRGLATDEVVPDAEALGLGDEVLLAADALWGLVATERHNSKRASTFCRNLTERIESVDVMQSWYLFAGPAGEATQGMYWSTHCCCHRSRQLSVR